MGHAAAEAVVRAGLQLVPITMTGYSAGVAVSNIGIAGIPVELVGKDRRQEAMDKVKERHPGLIVVDYTMPNCVNGEGGGRSRRRRLVFWALGACWLACLLVFCWEMCVEFVVCRVSY